ncbi:MAG: hypothetical protein K2Q26_06935 [Bdellovibrionales bacterium]|nr:hypothetical protein [Bdellovibrionales bacterium]
MRRLSVLCFLLISFWASYGLATSQCYFEKVYRYYGTDPLFQPAGGKKEYSGCRRRIGGTTVFFTAKQVAMEDCAKVCEKPLSEAESSAQHGSEKKGH